MAGAATYRGWVPSGASRPWLPRPALVFIAVAVVAIVAVVVLIRREGPDRTVVGVVAVVEDHRVCVEPGDGAQVCSQVDRPGDVADVEQGDCVRMRRSGGGILVSIDRISRARSGTPCPPG